MEGVWKNYRSRWCYFRGKKVKLRKYIHVASLQMANRNKAGWEKVNHLNNYKAALNRYGFPGLKHYENYYYKGVPLPEKRTLAVNFGLWMAALIANVLDSINKNFKFLKK